MCRSFLGSEFPGNNRSYDADSVHVDISSSFTRISILHEHIHVTCVVIPFAKDLGTIKKITSEALIASKTLMEIDVLNFRLLMIDVIELGFPGYIGKCCSLS